MRHISIAPVGEYWISEDLGGPTEEEAMDMTGSICRIDDKKCEFDYYQASIRKCEKLGGHLATLAELKIAYNNGKLSGSVFPASEENYIGGLCVLSGNTGSSSYSYKNMQNHHIICVGDN